MGKWGEREESREWVRLRLPQRLEPRWSGEGNRRCAERVGGGCASNRTTKERGGVMVSRRSGGVGPAEGGVGQPGGPVSPRAPLVGQDQGVAAVGTTQCGGGLGSIGLGSWQRAGAWALGRRLTGGLLGE